MSREIPLDALALKLCPFCKSAALTLCMVLKYADSGLQSWAICCLRCEARGPRKEYKEQAQNAWDDRAGLCVEG